MVLTRLLAALVLIPVILIVLNRGELPFLVLVLLATGIGCYEFYAMFQQSGRRPAIRSGIVLALLVVALSYPGVSDLLGGRRITSGELSAAILILAVLMALTYRVVRGKAGALARSDWMLTLAGVLYIGWLMRYAILLRSLPWGWEWSLMALVTTWAADTGAFFTGRAIGKHKLAPTISPGKTWEGVVGGLVLTLLVALLGHFLPLHLALWQTSLLGAMVAVAAVLGDLAESLLKRAAGVKDSGALIPGHGGLLDRADSLLFVLPVVYFFAIWIVG